MLDSQTTDFSSSNMPETGLSLWLLEAARKRGVVWAILRSGTRMARVGRVAALAAEDVEVLTIPAWDSLPYDRVAPSAGVAGRRIKALMALAEKPIRPRLVLTSAAAVLARVRPPRSWAKTGRVIRRGEALDIEALRHWLALSGYHWDERVDEPGEVALRGETIELFPAASDSPVRLSLGGEERLVEAIHCYDPLTLRSTGEIEAVTLHPAAEQRLDEAEVAEMEAQMEHPDVVTSDEHEREIGDERLVAPLSLMSGAVVYADAEVEDRWASMAEAIQDGYAAASAARRAKADAQWIPAPDRLYVTADQAAKALAGHERLWPDGDWEAVEAPLRLAELETLLAGVEDTTAVILAAPDDGARVTASLGRRGIAAQLTTDWSMACQPGVHVVTLELTEGLRRERLLVVPIGNLIRHKPGDDRLMLGENELRPGDVVVHEDHGVTRLTGLREVDGGERVALAFADGAELLVAPDELGRVWRYGNEGDVSLDRIGGEAWRRRRAEIEVEIAESAAALARAARARQEAQAPVLVPERAAYAQVARRFPYPLSADQRQAITAVLNDLESGRPMNRLICGDVGFGKTEIAVRAAAAVAFAGHQVLVAAPTTVLARQHLEVFQRRFAGTGVRVEGIIRTGAAEGRAVRKALSSGEVHIVVGTGGLAGLRLARPGLAVVDEEQRFGEDAKQALRAPHNLVMTATPIPRTLQGALAGLRDVSVLTTPPARRLPTRSFVLHWEDGVVREALLRERRRGGQSFVVCPRIADVIAMRDRLSELVPELTVMVAHGRLKTDGLEAVIAAFAGGEGDVLLATDIIEAGLDIPRANLMLVWGADRFGLAQLHQLRGRVGRGARRGAAYFMTEPGRRLTQATRQRLRTMETVGGLGAGFAIAAADMDARGAGDLFGTAQAGHVRAIGTELYQHLLAAAVAGKTVLAAPMLKMGVEGRIPAGYVPEEGLRLGLYRRLAKVADSAGLVEFGHEIEDRFGPVPQSMTVMLSLQALRLACVGRGVAMVEAGPQGVAFTASGPLTITGGEDRGGRVVVKEAVADPVARVNWVLGLLRA